MTDRQQRQCCAENILCISGVTIDVYNATITKNGENIYLSMLEYRILLLLMRNAGKVVDRKVILDSISYGNCQFLNENTLTVYIKRIRKKLGEEPGGISLIKTVRSKGYIIEKKD